MRASSAYSLFDTESVWAILMRIAPPVMLAQLIQAMYNIVDSYFVGQFSSDGLTALSIVYPVQLIVTAIAVGTGVGVNTLMSRYDGQGNHHLADRTAGTGTVLALISWLIFAVLSGLLMRPFAAISTESSSVADLAVTYGTIVCGAVRVCFWRVPGARSTKPAATCACPCWPRSPAPRPISCWTRF